jgi:hypothetical protein
MAGPHDTGLVRDVGYHRKLERARQMIGRIYSVVLCMGPANGCPQTRRKNCPSAVP